MDPLIILLLVIIGLAGGGIGVLADHLGRRIGKKKLSFRSMRPKHVARLGTFIAGFLVSTVTIILVFFTSSDIRAWIIRGRGAITRANELTAQNGQLEGQIRSKTSQIDQLDGEAKEARQRLSDAQTHLTEVKGQLASTVQRYTDATRKVELGKRALASNQDLLRKTKAQLGLRQAALKTVAANLKSAQTHYAELQKNFSAVDKERKEANDEVVSLRQQEDTLSTQIAQLRKDYAQVTKDKDDAKLALNAARGELDSVQSDLRQAQASLKAANDELDNVRARSYSLQSLAATTRREALVFQYGQEVRRLEVGANLSQAQAQRAFDKLMEQSDGVAREKGAATARGSLLSVFIPNVQRNGSEIDPRAYESDIVNSITGQDHDVVLIAQAIVNTFRSESVPLTITVEANPVVYHKNEVLAELKVGRGWPPERVMVEFDEFMRQQVHDKIKGKMIPVAGEQASLVSIERAKTFDVVEHLARAPRETVLEVSAHAETRAADLLQLDFKFK